MELTRLNLRQTLGQTAIESQAPQLRIDRRPAALDLHSEAARLDISGGRATLSIDGSDTRAAVGIYGQAEFTAQFAADGRNAALAAAGRIATDGDELAAFQYGGNPIARQAGAMSDVPPVEVAYGYLPGPAMRFDVQPAQISVQEGGVQGSFQRGKLDIGAQRGDVSVSVSRRPDLRIWATQGRYDLLA